MSSTSTRQISLERLRARGADAAVVVKLMMACNDLTLANLALADWKGSQPRSRRDLEVGARMYFVRVELAHLFEGMKIIGEIQKTSSLLQIVTTCDSRTRDSFAKLETFVHGGANRAEFEKLVGQVRHNLTFHYHQCDKLVLQAIEDRAGRPEARLSSITRGSEMSRWRFTVADDIVESIVVRGIWSVPRGADLQTEVDRIADRVHEILLFYVDFAGEFIWKFCEA